MFFRFFLFQAMSAGVTPTVGETPAGDYRLALITTCSMGCMSSTLFTFVMSPLKLRAS